MDIVQRFEREVLIEFFRNYKVPDSVSSIIIKDIKIRMYSLLEIWGNLEDRRAILTIGLEEGIHYEPINAPIEIKAFVVATIRNSDFENLVSTQQSAKKYGSNVIPLPEGSEKELTKKAIEFLCEMNFSDHCYNGENVNNIYSDLFNKYPLSTRALRRLGVWSNKGIRYEKLLKENEVIDLAKIQQYDHSKEDNILVESGMELAFDKRLIEHLMMISKSSDPVFYSDSFKSITRNIEKLFMVLEYVLNIDGKFITNNFFITNGYVSKRKELLKPMHTEKDFIQNMNNISGLTKTHLQYIKLIQNGLNGY